MDPKELEQRLRPDHIPAIGDLKAELEKTVENPIPEKLPENDPKFQEEWTFKFSWKDGRGKVWEGTFTNHILSMREQSMVGALRAHLSGGLPYTALPAGTNDINFMISHLNYSLADKDRAGWSKDLQAIKDVALLQALYAEVASHEATFFGWPKAD